MRSLMKPAELALACRVTERTVKAWARRGLIRLVRLPGGQLRVEQQEAERVVRQEDEPEPRSSC